MQLTVAIYRQGSEDFMQIEVASDMTIAVLKSLIEDDANIPSAQIDLFYQNQKVTSDKQTIAAAGISDGDIVSVRVRRAQQPQSQPPQARQQQQPSIPQQVRDAAERLRLQAIAQPQLQNQLRDQAPELAAAVQNANAFAEQYMEMVRKQQQAEEEHQRMLARLDDDPFDIEAQRKIEEIIRNQQVMKNYEDAVENMPEAFGRVIMLYVNVEVNGVPVKAFVDSGAQATIMSPACAERCGIMRLLDRRFAGIAKGVGTAKILGRVHSADLAIGKVHLGCSFTVMEGKDVELLFGLDMLKRHQAIIDLTQNALVIQGETVPFLPESEIPRSELNFGDEPAVEGPAGLKTGAKSGAVIPPSEGQSSQPGPSTQPTASSVQRGLGGPQFPTAHIEQLVALGFSREEAISALTATNGDVDQAGALLFG